MTETRDIQSVVDAAEQAAAAGDYSSAEQLLTEVAVLQGASLGPLHPDLANTLNNLGVVCEILEKPARAERHFRRACEIAKASLEPNHPFVATSRKNLEDFCNTRGIPVDAPPSEPEVSAEIEMPASLRPLPSEPEPELPIPSPLPAPYDDVPAIDAVDLPLETPSYKEATPSYQELRPAASGRWSWPVAIAALDRWRTRRDAHRDRAMARRAGPRGRAEAGRGRTAEARRRTGESCFRTAAARCRSAQGRRPRSDTACSATARANDRAGASRAATRRASAHTCSEEPAGQNCAVGAADSRRGAALPEAFYRRKLELRATRRSGQSGSPVLLLASEVRHRHDGPPSVVSRGPLAAGGGAADSRQPRRRVPHLQPQHRRRPGFIRLESRAPDERRRPAARGTLRRPVIADGDAQASGFRLQASGLGPRASGLGPRASGLGPRDLERFSPACSANL